MSSVITTCLWLVAIGLSMLNHRHEKRRADAAEKRARALEHMLKSATIVGAMIRGQRPIVRDPPHGMTVDEAQALINDIFESLQPSWAKNRAAN